MNKQYFLKTKAVKNWSGPVLATLLFLLMQLPAYGQNITKPNITAPSGIQVNSYTGNLFCKRNDLVIPAPGLPLDISFSYNSTERNKDQGFGKGWTLSYNLSYSIDTTGSITISRGDGRKDRYALINGVLKAPAGVFDELTEYATGKFRLRTKNSITYFFEDAAHKRLTRISDRNDNKTILTYNDTLIDVISDSLGHEIHFAWNNGKLAGIQAQAAAEQRSVQYEYNALGYLTSVRKPQGVVVSYAYGANGALNNYTDANGNTTGITYNSSNAVVKLLSCELEQRIAYNPEQHKTYVTELNNGNTLATTYAFDAQGRLTRKTGNCCGYNTAYEYDQQNNITRITDGNNGIRLFSYDSKGNVLAETDQLQQTMLYTYHPLFNDITGITDKKGNLTTFSYDNKGNLLQETDAFSHTVIHTYDNRGNRLSSTDRKGYITRYAYDTYGYLSRQVGPQSDTTGYVNDAWGNVLQHTDPRHYTTAFAYDSLYRVKTVTDALQHTTRFTYDANDNRLSVMDARGKVTSFVYNWRNKPVTMIDAGSHATQMTYDGMGNLLSVTDAGGRTSVFGYDNLNRLKSKTDAAGDMTAYTYDGVGNRVEIAYPNGNKVHLEYDALSRLTKAEDNKGPIVQYSYDANGNRLTEQDGKGSNISYNYDALDRMLTRTDALGNTGSFAYDFNDNLVQEMDRKGHATSYTYDSLNRRRTMTDALSHVTEQQYDKTGNLVQLTDANGNATKYAYDALDRLIQEKFADLTTRNYSYDSADNLQSRTDNAGQVTQYRYDDLNRPVLRIYNAGDTDTFTYSPAGLLLSARNASATVVFTYDVANRLSSETLNGQVTSYTYNTAAGKRTVVYPGGRMIERQLDARNQLSALRENGTDLAAYEYDAAGGNTLRTYRNGTVSNISYNSNGQVSNLNHNPAHFVDLGYSYDYEDNPTAAQFLHQPGHSEQYSYDNLNQVTAFIKGGASQGSYTYDGVGNRSAAQLNGIPAGYTISNMNAYSSIVYGNTFNLAYDLNGNLTDDDTRQYTYDRENRIVSVDGGAVAAYAYDALGRRIRKIADGDTTLYYYDGMQLIEERDGAGAVKATYVWGRWIDDIVSMQRNAQDYFYHSNALGSVVAVTNTSGQVVEQYEYDAFGKATVYNNSFVVLPGGSAIGNTWLYTGRQLDPETGLYYYRARYYDPAHGRFLQRDPLGYVDGMGLYAYVGNNVSNSIDPMGMVKWWGVSKSLIGMGTNLLGVVVGVGIGVATSWTGVGAVAGGVIAVKSAYGFSANTQNLWNAFNDEDPISTGALFNDIARQIAPCNENYQNIATALDIGTDLIGPGGLSKILVRRIGGAMKSGTTVIGEGMARVEAAASKIPGANTINGMPKFTGTADQITSQMMQYNRKWILNEMRSGRTILDIGRDLSRANPSIFYQMEQNMLRNYQKLHPGSLNIIIP